MGASPPHQRLLSARRPRARRNSVLNQIAALEERIGVTFPEDYRQFLGAYNGGYFIDPAIEPVVDGCPQCYLTCMYGIGASHPTAELARQSDLELFDDNDPPAIVPIGDTPMGSLILLITHADGRGQILLKEAYGDSFFLADGINEFFELLREPDKQ